MVLLGEFLRLRLISSTSLMLVPLMTIWKNVLLRSCWLLVKAGPWLPRRCWFNRGYTSIVTTKSSLLSSAISVTWISLSVDLCFGSLMQVLAYWIGTTDKWWLIGERSLELSLCLCTARLTSFWWRHTFAWPTLCLFHSRLIIESCWVYLIDAFNIEVLDIVRCSNNLSIVIFFSALIW